MPAGVSEDVSLLDSFRADPDPEPPPLDRGFHRGQVRPLPGLVRPQDLAPRPRLSLPEAAVPERFQLPAPRQVDDQVPSVVHRYPLPGLGRETFPGREWTPYEAALCAQADRQIVEDCSYFYFRSPEWDTPQLPAVAELSGRFPYAVTAEGVVCDSFTGEVLEEETEALAVAQRKAKAGRFYASALAERLVGGPVHLGQDDCGEMILLGAHGEELQAGPGEAKILRAAALLLLEAATPWAAIGQDDSKPGKARVYGVGGSGYAPGFRLSPGYQRKHAASSRKEARKMVKLLRRRLGFVSYEQSKEQGGQVRPVALTLTSPTIDPGLLVGLLISDETEEKRLFRAWELFRKRQAWIDRVFGGFRGYEITRQVHTDGWMTFHPHFHILAFAKYMEQAGMALEWWDCLRTATEEVYGFDLDSLYDSEDRDAKDRTALDRARSASLYVQAIRPKVKPGAVRDALGHREGPMTLEDALQETLKYACKADKIATYERDLERPGELRATGLPTEYLQKEIYRRSCRIFECVGAARSIWTPPEWCELAGKVSEELLAELTGEATKRAAERAAEAASCSLDTPPISDGELDGTPAQGRRTLRKLMDELSLHQWLQVASARAFKSLDSLRAGLQKKGFFVPELVFESPG
jgi:hypothetical protein